MACRIPRIARDPRIVKILRRYDAPCIVYGQKAACPPDKEPCGCELNLAGKSCPCTPRWRLCQHVIRLAEEMDDADYPFSLDEADEILRSYYPKEYADPPLPPTPAVRIAHAEALVVFETRAGITKAGGQPRFALRHPHDVTPRQLDTLSTQAQAGKIRGELITTAAEHRRTEAITPDPGSRSSWTGWPLLIAPSQRQQQSPRKAA